MVGLLMLMGPLLLSALVLALIARPISLPLAKHDFLIVKKAEKRLTISSSENEVRLCTEAKAGPPNT